MSRIGKIQSLARNGLYYLTEHADYEATDDGFDIYDVEQGLLTGKLGELGLEKANTKWLELHGMGDLSVSFVV